MSCNKLTHLVGLAEKSERISLRGMIPNKKEQLISQMKEELEESGMSFEEMYLGKPEGSDQQEENV